MSKESYIRGFCKAAEAHGVDPQALAKFAMQKKQVLVLMKGWKCRGLQTALTLLGL